MLPIAIGLALLIQNATATKEPVAFAGEASSVEEYVREYFSDIPVMAEVAKCESRFRHFGKNGAVLRGELTPEDIGVMQINEYFHGATAEKLDLDIYSVEGNLAYARYLYEKEGVRPWNSSSRCWSKSAAALALK